jgi:uncharacterized protein
MSDANPVSLVQSLYAAFGRGDVPFLLDAVTEDVDWTLFGPTSIPYAGNFKGRDGVGRFFSLLGGSLEFQAFEPRKFISEGDTVVVLGRERATVRATGRVFDVEWVHVFVVRDGKAAKFTEYTNSADVAAAFAG